MFDRVIRRYELTIGHPKRDSNLIINHESKLDQVDSLIKAQRSQSFQHKGNHASLTNGVLTMAKTVVKLTNAQFVKENQGFIAKCYGAGIPATKRQASKYRRKLGKAYNA